jgi:hypothetical protein
MFVEEPHIAQIWNRLDLVSRPNHDSLIISSGFFSVLVTLYLCTAVNFFGMFSSLSVSLSFRLGPNIANAFLMVLTLNLRARVRAQD